MPIESLDAIYEMVLKNIENDEMHEIAFKNMDIDAFYWMHDTNEEIDEQINQIELRETLEILMGELTIKERDVLKARYGFKDGVEKTLEEVGQMFGVTRERIRQIESKAIRKLSHPKRIAILKDFL